MLPPLFQHLPCFRPACCQNSPIFRSLPFKSSSVATWYRAVFSSAHNLLNLTGLHAEYGSYSSYYKFVSKKENQKEHSSFLKALAQWIQAHNENPQEYRLRDTKALKAVKQSLLLERTQGGKFIAPRMKFVEEQHWKEEQYGKLDTAKVVEEEIHGKVRKGAWVRVGAEGEWDYENYEDRALKEQTEEHNGEGLFAKEAFARKQKAAQSALDKTHREREAAVASSQVMDTSALLAIIAQSRSSNDAPTADKAAASAASSNSDHEDEESDDEGPGATATFFGSKRKAGASKAAPKVPAKAAKAKQTSAPSTSARGGKASQTAPASSSKASKVESAQVPKKNEAKSVLVAAAADGTAESTMALDGRAQRTLRTLQKSLSDQLAALQAINVDDGPTPVATAAQAAYKTDCKKREGELRKIAKNVREVIKRAEKSTNKDAFGDELTKLDEVGQAANALADLFSVMPVPCAQADLVTSAYEAALVFFTEESAILASQTLGSGFRLKYVLAKASCHFFYEEYKKFCDCFKAEEEEIQALATLVGRESLEQQAALEMEGRLVSMLQGIPEQELQDMDAGKSLADDSQLVKTLSLARLVMDSCDDEGFLARSLKGDVTVVASLLDSSNVLKLEAAVGTLSEVATASTAKKGASEKALMTPIQRFFLQCAGGQSLYALASARVTAGEQESKFEALVVEAEELLKSFPESIPAGFSQDQMADKINSFFVPANQKVGDVQKQLKQAVKAASQGQKERLKARFNRLKEDFAKKVTLLTKTFLVDSVTEVMWLGRQLFQIV